MRTTCVWLAAALLVACSSADRGGSLRGALEALQRRQRGRVHVPLAPPVDYDTLYEFVPPQVQYPENDYVDVEDFNEEQPPKYIVKLLDDNEKPSESYEYKIIKKKNSRLEEPASAAKKESAFRERTQHSDNERLRDLFMDRNDADEKEDVLQDRVENDAEYALLLGQLWSKYKNNRAHPNNIENEPQGVVKLFKEKIVKKRYPGNWGPIAFKRKRSSDMDMERLEYETERKDGGMPDSNYNAYDVSNDDKDDMREEYAIAFQPLDDENLPDLSDDDQYTYEGIEKRFPVSKRSSGAYNTNMQKKRFVQNKRAGTKTFRSSAGTDPKIIKDLSKIFGDSELEIIKTPVKRSSDHADSSHEHEVKPPILLVGNNNTHDHNNMSSHDDDSHEQHGHNIHHPGFSGKEVDHDHEQHDNEHEQDVTIKPKNIKKKSIDWSDYFGIDKRFKKSVSFVNNLSQDRLKKQYFDTFNKEVIYPVNSFRKHTNVKRNYIQPKSKDERQAQLDVTKALEIRDAKRNTASENESKLDNIDKKLRNMEGLIVDEALHYSTMGDEVDSKEEQEVKEKLLSRLAAAYSLEKMRKALKEFKQSLQTHRSTGLKPTDSDDAKNKRVAIKKEKAFTNDIPNFNKDDSKENDFEDEQGAGHYLNGKIEEELSEGYMGGSGRHRSPVMSTAGSGGSCPVLAKIMQRCRGVDLLAGDRGQLFLPLCSLHQICYLCGEAPPTTCDLVFLSEADTTCEGDMSCQRAARSALMALRELHDNLADELDGECEASPCLPATLKLNIGWQRALQR